MIRTIMISTVLVGTGGFCVWPSMAAFSTLSETKVFTGLIETESAALGLEIASEHSFGFHRFLVQRKSSKPPGEGQSGRVSSSPPGSIPESKRDSGRPSDLGEGHSHSQIRDEKQESSKNPVITPKKDHDPIEGGGKSTPGFNRRGAARK